MRMLTEFGRGKDEHSRISAEEKTREGTKQITGLQNTITDPEYTLEGFNSRV